MIWHTLVLYGLLVLIARSLDLFVPGFSLVSFFTCHSSIFEIATQESTPVPGSWISTKPGEFSLDGFQNNDETLIGNILCGLPSFKQIALLFKKIETGTPVCTTIVVTEFATQRESKYYTDSIGNVEIRTPLEPVPQREGKDLITGYRSPDLQDSLDDGWRFQRRKRRRIRKNTSGKVWKNDSAKTKIQTLSPPQNCPKALHPSVKFITHCNPYQALIGLEDEELEQKMSLVKMDTLSKDKIDIYFKGNIPESSSFPILEASQIIGMKKESEKAEETPGSITSSQLSPRTSLTLGSTRNSTSKLLHLELALRLKTLPARICTQVLRNLPSLTTSTETRSPTF